MKKATFRKKQYEQRKLNKTMVAESREALNTAGVSGVFKLPTTVDHSEVRWKSAKVGGTWDGAVIYDGAHAAPVYAPISIGASGSTTIHGGSTVGVLPTRPAPDEAMKEWERTALPRMRRINLFRVEGPHLRRAARHMVLHREQMLKDRLTALSEGEENLEASLHQPPTQAEYESFTISDSPDDLIMTTGVQSPGGSFTMQANDTFRVSLLDQYLDTHTHTLSSVNTI